MSVIEIACFRLESTEIQATSKPFLADAPHDQPTATLRFYLSHAIRVLSKSAKHPFYLVQDLEDSLIIYYLGKWPSLEAYTTFHDSKDRGELLSDLAGCQAVMQWSGFYSIAHYEHWESSFVSALLHKEKALTAASLVGITRLNVAPEDRSAFEETFRKSMPHLERYSGHKGAAGWKIETKFNFDGSEIAPPVSESTPALQRDEFAILGGWNSKEQYDDFRDSEDYMQYVQIRGSAKWFERLVGKVIRLE